MLFVWYFSWDQSGSAVGALQATCGRTDSVQALLRPALLSGLSPQGNTGKQIKDYSRIHNGVQ